MRRLAIGIILTLVAASVLPADTWCGIDGFYLHTAEGIDIGPDDDEAVFVEFRFPGEEESAVAGRLVQSGGVLSDLDMAVIQGLSMARAVAREGEIESMELIPYVTNGGVEGHLMTVQATEGWHEVFIADLGDTPGGIYSHILILARYTGEDGRDYLDRFLEGFSIEIAEAAG